MLKLEAVLSRFWCSGHFLIFWFFSLAVSTSVAIIRNCNWSILHIINFCPHLYYTLPCFGCHLDYFLVIILTMHDSLMRLYSILTLHAHIITRFQFTFIPCLLSLPSPLLSWTVKLCPCVPFLYTSNCNTFLTLLINPYFTNFPALFITSGALTVPRTPSKLGEQSHSTSSCFIPL